MKKDTRIYSQQYYKDVIKCCFTIKHMKTSLLHMCINSYLTYSSKVKMHFSLSKGNPIVHQIKAFPNKCSLQIHYSSFYFFWYWPLSSTGTGLPFPLSSCKSCWYFQIQVKFLCLSKSSSISSVFRHSPLKYFYYRQNSNLKDFKSPAKLQKV